MRPQRWGVPPRQRVDQVLAALPRRQWRTVRWRHGTKGWLRKKFVAVRGWRITAEGEAHIGWLLGERAARGQPGGHKYFWRNLPASGSLGGVVDYAPCPHAIEQLEEGGQEGLGWGQDQGRVGA